MTTVSPTYTIGTWSAGGAGIVDANGTTLAVQGTTGLYDSAGVRTNQIPFPTNDGVYRSRSFLGPGVLVLNGWGQGTTRQGVAATRRILRNLFTGGGQKALVITDIDDVQFTCMVELDVAGVKVSPVGDGLDFDWQLNLSMADPLLYSNTPSSGSTSLAAALGGLDYSTGGGLDYTGGSTGGLVYGTPGPDGTFQLTNSGLVDAWPEFTIFGSTDGSDLQFPSITDTSIGRVIAYGDTIHSGDTLKIITNPSGRSVRLNGTANRRNVLTKAQWFKIPAGATHNIQFQGNNGLGTTTILSGLLAAAY